MELDAIEPKNGRAGKTAGLFFLAMLTVLLLGTAAFVWLLCERGKPQVALSEGAASLGFAKKIGLAAADGGSGLRAIRLTLVQGDKLLVIFEKSFPRRGYFSGAGPKKFEEFIQVSAKKEGFVDGEARLLVTAVDYSFWNWTKGNKKELSLPVQIDTKPPIIGLLESPEFIKGGGAGVIVYQSAEPLARHGVMINRIFYPGFALPKRGKGVYGACLGLPFDIASLDQAYVSATDPAGNEGRAPIGMTLHVRKIVTDQITISDGFLSAKLPEFAAHYPELQGTPVEQYLMVNREIRKRNNQKIAEICGSFHPERLWEGRFLRMAASPRAGYADRRSYLYAGEIIDEQVHLGVDLASLERAAVEAANRGKVAFADYLGIYGNMIILDHGQGIFSLYSHLSQIDVAVGSLVEKGAVIGRTGTTGMAGGDHLHFSMLVNGIFVDPIEWWDEEWLRLHLLSSL